MTLPDRLTTCFAEGWLVTFAFHPNLQPSAPFTCYIDNIFPINSVHPKKTHAIGADLLEALDTAISAAYAIANTVDTTKPYIPPPAAPAINLRELLGLTTTTSTGKVRRL